MKVVIIKSLAAEGPFVLSCQRWREPLLGAEGVREAD